MRYGSRVKKIRYISRRLRIKVSGRWCRLRYKSGIWEVKLPGQRRWKPILRQERKWFVRYRGRRRYLPRGFKTFGIKFGRVLKPLRPLGGRGLYTVKIGKKSYRTMKLRYTWRTRFQGKLLPVRRTGNYASLRFKGKWYPKARISFPRRKLRRGRDINICYLPAGRSVLGKTVPEVFSTARGRGPRAQFFPIQTDLVRQITCLFFSSVEHFVSSSCAEFSLQPFSNLVYACV